MTNTTSTIPPSHTLDRSSNLSRSAVWVGRVLSTIATLFLLFDCTIKILRMPAAVEGTVKVGYPAGVVAPIGFILLACLVVYVIPRTAPLGAVLLTGYLGGAVATNVRVGAPMLTFVLAPVYVAVLIWGGLWLRDARVRNILASRR
ncbi:MAG: DoxX family protein [Thermoanaerobaculia bacterium]